MRFLASLWRMGARAFARRTVHRILAILVILLSLSSILIGIDLRVSVQAVTTGDLRFIAMGARTDERVLWAVPDDALSRFVQRRLGLDDDLAFRDALARSAAASASRDGADARRAVEVLKRFVESEGDATQRSYAANLIGLWMLRAASSNDSTLILSAFEAFRVALRLNPKNAAARYNLELLWTLLLQQKGGDDDDAGSRPPGGGY